jgi:hypothetical protein
MTRLLLAVLVAALVVLAGCSGAPATSTTPEEGTDAPTTEEAPSKDGEVNRVTVPSNVRPPGAAARRIASPRTLLRAHGQVLANASVEASLAFTSLSADTTGVVRYNVTRSNGARYASSRRLVGNGTPTGEDVFHDDDAVSVRSVGANETTYSYATGPTRLRFQYAQPSQPFPSVAMFYFGVASGMQATGFDTMNGETVTRYETTGVNDSAFDRYRGAIGVPEGSVEDFSFVVFVDADGVVHEATARLTAATADGTTREFVLDYDVTGVGGVDVEEPAWTREVRQVNASVVANGTAVRVQNVGSQPVFDHDIGLAGNVTAQTTVNRTLDAGATRYVYVTGSGNETTMHVVDGADAVPATARVLPSRGMVSVFIGSANTSISMGVTTTSGNATDARDPTSDERWTRTTSSVERADTVRPAGDARGLPALGSERVHWEGERAH